MTRHGIINNKVKSDMTAALNTATSIPYGLEYADGTLDWTLNPHSVMTSSASLGVKARPRPASRSLWVIRVRYVNENSINELITD